MNVRPSRFSVSRSRHYGPRAPQRGATALEMALLTPILFALTIGAFEVGRAVWTKHTLTHVAREAARYASVRSVTSDDPVTASMVEARAKSEANGIDPEYLQVLTTWSPTNEAGATVHVQVSYQFQPSTALVPFKTLELTSNAQRVISF